MALVLIEVPCARWVGELGVLVGRCPRFLVLAAGNSEVLCDVIHHGPAANRSRACVVIRGPPGALLGLGGPESAVGTKRGKKYLSRLQKDTTHPRHSAGGDVKSYRHI